MSRFRCLSIVAVVLLLLLLGVGGGIWWYLFGANSVAAAELVPADTVVFATIPNGVSIAAGYQSSQLKTLVDSPNTQPLADAITNMMGQKTLDVLKTFAPNLSGQSFIALTHFDPSQPTQIGFIAAMKPKAGYGDFNAFLDQLKANWPDALKSATTGTGNVAGVDYQWIKGPGAPDKLCVAQVSGWIVTTWGEASLQDWIERFNKKSTTPSLAQNPDYQQSLARIGLNPMSLLYVNSHALVDLIQKQATTANPAAADFISKKLGTLGGAAVGTRFENGEIVDRFSFLMPRQAQLDSGMAASTCPFDTLKFTGNDTRFYWASSINFQQYWKNLQEQASQSPTLNPTVTSIIQFIQTWAQGAGLDVQRNIIDPLGSEFSVQAEWPVDGTWPEVGLFVKLDKPDDFKPTITAIIETARKAYETSAVVNELNSNGQDFAALKFVQPSLITPTITEGGPYLGVFISENQAVRSFQRNELTTLPHNDDFARQVGDKRNTASQVMFIDTPRLLDRAYRNAVPYISMASMFNQQLAAMLKNRTLPDDLTWLAPMGTWSMVVTPDDAGLQIYSASGIGNQGILLSLSAGAAFTTLQTMGVLPKTGFNMTPPPPPAPVVPPPIPPPAPTPVQTPVAVPPTPPAAPSTASSTNAPDTSPTLPTTPTPAPPTNSTSAPDTSTNAAPTPAPDATTNAAPSSAPDTAPATAPVNSTSNAIPATPDAPKSE